MSESERVYTLTFRAPVGVFTGLGIAGLVDRTVMRDASGVPFIPGSTVKGRLRFFAERLLSGDLPTGYRFHGTGKPHCKSSAGACTLCKLFGNPSLPSRVRVGQAALGEPWRSIVVALLAADPNPVVRPDVEIRPGIALSRLRRTTLQDHLFLDEAVPAGLQFEGRLFVDGSVTMEEEAFLHGVGAVIDALGARKATGRGALEGGVRIFPETAP